MERDYEDFELVHVIKPFRLIDSESYERLYWRRDGVALVPGYYVATWPRWAEARLFNEDTVFRGPFRERGAAQQTLERMRGRVQALRAATFVTARAA